MGLLTQLSHFCISLGFMPGNIKSPQAYQPVAVCVKKDHYYNDDKAQDYYVPWLEFYLALILVKVPYQAAHALGH